MSGDDENDTNEEENKTIVKNAPSSLPSSADDFPLRKMDDFDVNDDGENTEDETEEEKRVELDRRTHASSITINATLTTGKDYEEEATKTFKSTSKREEEEEKDVQREYEIKNETEEEDDEMMMMMMQRQHRRRKRDE